MFETYESRWNAHVAIHVATCNQLRKRGGGTTGGGKYEKHSPLIDASTYAKSTGLEVRYCPFCKSKE